MYQILLKNLKIFQVEINDQNRKFVAQKLMDEEIQIFEQIPNDITQLMEICKKQMQNKMLK